MGLAIGARLSRKPSNRVLLVERHSQLGQETSSRNSEVIHAGLYYPPEALRTKLCIEGKHSIYEHAKKYNIELQNCGKWIVAQTAKEAEYLEKMYERAKITQVPLNWLSLEKAKQLEPAVKANEAVIESPTTGIISAHSLMDFFEAQMVENEADISLGTTVTAITKLPDGYQIQCSSDGEEISITTDVLINSAGLSAPLVSNMLLPQSRHIKPYYAKGNYFAYTASRPKVSRLIYPCPSDFGGLGVHLTIDLGGRIKFGPDTEWVENPDDVQVSAKNLEFVKPAIRRYLDIDDGALVPDYAGIRPKIIPDGHDFQDFVIREEEKYPGFINLLSIESPGLTSSMAIARYVEELL